MVRLRQLKPGGWIELQEFGGQILSDDDSLGDSALPKFFDKMSEALGMFGMNNFYVAHELGHLLKEAGFVNASVKTIKAPVGTWPRVCGTLASRCEPVSQQPD